VSRKPRDVSSLLICFLLAGVTLATFWPVRHCEFVDYDDQGYVTQNPQVGAGLTWEGVAWALRTRACSNWHPLTWLSHMFDCQLYGLGPAGHHFTSLLLHVANVLLLFGALRGMTGMLWRSAMVAALFALHPLRVESVAWVSERKDVLSTLFFMLTLCAYARYVRQSAVNSQPSQVTTGATPKPQHLVFHFPSSIFYLLALFCFALGLMSKPMLVTLPCVLLLLDYWPLRRFPSSRCGLRLSALGPLLLEKLPFFLMSAGCSVLTLRAQQIVMIPDSDLTFGLRIENALVAGARYLGKVFWPADLAVFYPHPGQWPFGQVLGAGAVLLTVSALAATMARSQPFLLVGWLWFWGMLVPVIGLVQVGMQFMADRYTYAPSVGVFLLLVWLAGDISAGNRRMVWGLRLAGVVGLVACIVTTRMQLRHWVNTERLFEHALRVTPNNALAHYILAGVRDKQGKSEEVFAHLAEAIRLHPDYADAHNFLGAALLAQGKVEEAVVHFKRALVSDPNHAYAHSHLGITLLAQGKVDEAIVHLRRALELNPRLAKVHARLGLALGQKGRLDEAVEHFAEAIRLDPAFSEAYNELALLHLRQGRFADAEARFQQALERGANPAKSHYDLGRTCAALGKREAAIGHYRKALHLQPDWATRLGGPAKRSGLVAGNARGRA